jgi:hypothetical protein
MRAPRRRLALAALVLGCAQAGEVGRELGAELNPFGASTATVVAVSEHGPYLVADLRGRRANLRFLAPARDEVCRRLLSPESRLTYRKYGVFGRFERDGEGCVASGVDSLAAWRDRRPRAGGRPLPRATVRFSEISRDDSYVFVRGRFPLASRVGIPGGYDLVAMLPNSEGCAGPLARGEASMEFHDAGPEPYRLMVEGGSCPVLGFATPP